ncbi:MHYT domain-containing protein [Alteromonas sp. H39]|uniref:MHYT domain-containing protein n=1 Tax=Alteromonas sp. H39 TaxID=3389876 RepID=UPI0039E01977
MLQTIFQVPDTSLLVQGGYDPFLVFLSVAIAVFTSFMGFTVASQAASNTRKRNPAMLAIGSVALGGGIWSMHFLGMLAFELCTPVTYDFVITCLSALPGIIAGWVALKLLLRPTVTVLNIAVSGILMGAGIGAMHYSGMAAMEMAPLLRYSLPLFLLSIVVAVVLAMLALWIKFGLARFVGKRISERRKNALASVVMGLAIAGMHYTGMAAARFVKPPGFEASSQPSSISLYLATGITFFTVIMICVVLGISLLYRYRDMTARAIESERTQRAIMDTTVDAILTVNSRGMVETMNPAVTRILGWKQEDLVGQSVLKVIPAERRDIYDQNFFSMGKAANQDDIVGISRDAEALNKDGERVPVRVGVGSSKIRGQQFFVAFIADIRDRIEMERALRENEAKFRSFISNIPGIAYRCLDDAGWPMLFVSDAVEGITGYPPGAFCVPNPSKSFVDLYHPDDLEIIEKATEGRSHFEMEYRIFHKDGSIRWLRESGTFVTSEDGKSTWLDGFIMDITSRREMENALTDAKEVAEAAAAARTTFLANMSHEIRTPMNAIIGFSDLMLHEDLNSEQQKHMTTINRSARSLLHLLNDILDSAKLDKGKLELDYRSFVLTEEVDTVISTFWLEAKRKQLTLDVDVSEQLATAYRGAPERLRQVLNNLIGNAVKFTSEGRVLLEVKPEGNDVAFIISDTGIGMSEAQVEKVFDPFAQADASMSRKYGGTGLGTTISKQLVELMGGSIQASSVQGEGSVFSFRLPLAPAEPPLTPMSRSTPSSLPPLNVLVVDDIAQNVDLLTLLLQRDGHDVSVARNGEEALEAMKQPGLELVLMDLQMPVMDGLTASKLRRDYEAQNDLPALPIVALTASVLAQDKFAAEEAGMQGFANKPVDYPSLTQEIATVLGLDVEVTTTVLPDSPDMRAGAVDSEKGAALWGSERDHLREVSRFLDQVGKTVNALQSAMEKGQQEEQKALSHGLKGVSGNLGLRNVMAAAKDLEEAAGSLGITADLLLALNGAISEVEKWVSQQAEAQPTASEATMMSAELLGHLRQLLESVQQNRLDEDELGKLASASLNQYQEAVQAILENIDDFEFERAQQELKALIAILAETQE